MSSIKDLVVISGDAVEIRLQSTVNLGSLELLLKEAYPASKRPAHTTILFNFRFVRWIDSLQWSMIAQWILELKELHKAVRVVYPTNKAVISLFDSYRFTHFLQIHGIATDRDETASSFPYADRPYLPLTFVNGEEYKKILDDLSNPKVFAAMFDDINYSLIGSKGLLRDVIIKELGDNMNIHGEARMANLLATKIKGALDGRQFKLTPQQLPDDILDNLHVVVVISDKGNGIYKTLKDAYLKDKRTTRKKAKPSVCDLIVYSTSEDASSRSSTERLAYLVNSIAAEIGSIELFTGLFQVKQMVKKYMGVLTIRSGNSFVIFNYYEGRGKEHIVRSEDAPGYRTLANFGGTQVKVVLPVLADYREFEDQLYGKFIIREANEKITYHYLSISDFFEEVRKEEQVPAACQKLLSEIKEQSAEPGQNSIILDFKTNQISIDTKVKVVIIYHLIKYQEIYNKSHTLINCDPALLDLMNDSLENRKFHPTWPIIAFNTWLYRDVIGVRSEERKLFQEIQTVERLDADRLVNFANKYKSLFVYEKKSDTWSIRHSRPMILDVVKKSMEAKLRGIVLNPASGILHSGIKVLTPNGIYFDKYFEVFTLFDDPDWSYLVRRWLELLLHELKPQCVISITSWVGSCIADLISTSEIPAVKELLHLNLLTPAEMNRTDLSELIYLLDKDKSAVIVTDVIATGNSLRDMLESHKSIKITNCICSVNLNTSREIRDEKNGLRVPITAIYHEPVIGFTSKPRDWQYDEIHEVNRDTHKIYIKTGISKSIPAIRSIFESPLPAFTLQKRVGPVPAGAKSGSEAIENHINPFIESVLIPNNAFQLRIVSNNRYIPVFYKIPTILNAVGNEIKDDLIACIGKVWDEHDIMISRLVTMGNELDYKHLVSQLYTYLPNVQVDHLSYNHLNRYHNTDNLEGQGIIVIDDAFFTGENYFRILEYFSAKNAGFVLIYVLIKRASDRVANRLRNIGQFGNMLVDFKYLFEGRVAMYDDRNNPIERHLLNYETLLTKFAALPIADFIGKRIAGLKYRDVAEGSLNDNPDNLHSASYLRLRWKLEYAKKDIGTRKSLSVLFDGPESTEDVLLLFSILIEEKYNFLASKSFMDIFFYPKFTKKVLDTCVRLLINKKLSLSPVDIANTLEMGFTLSPEWLAGFVKYELPDLLINESIVDSIICILCLAAKDHPISAIKADFLAKVTAAEVDDSRKQLYLFLEKIWHYEERELTRYDLNKAKNIRELLRSSFHDISPKVKNLKAYYQTDQQEAFSIFRNLIESVQESAKGFINLFIGDSFNEIKRLLQPKFEALETALLKGQRLIDDIGSSNLSTYAYLFPEYADAILSALLAEDGIVEVLKLSFRTNIKKEFTNLFIPMLQEQGKTVLFRKPTDSCLAFCIPNDFRDIISNIRENILIHSRAERVMVEVAKKVEGEKHLIQINIYDDGKKVDKISIGHGVSRCITLCKTYSGAFAIGKIPANEFPYEDGYRTFARIELYDLSVDILKLPNDAE